MEQFFGVYACLGIQLTFQLPCLQKCRSVVCLCRVPFEPASHSLTLVFTVRLHVPCVSSHCSACIISTKHGKRMGIAATVGVGEPLATFWFGADEWLFTRVQTLVSLQLATLGKCSLAARKVTYIWLLTSVRPHVSLEGLVAWKNAVAHLTLDVAGGRRAFADQRRDGIQPRATATLAVVRRAALRRRRTAPGDHRRACAAGARALQVDRFGDFMPVPRVVRLVSDRRARDGECWALPSASFLAHRRPKQPRNVRRALHRVCRGVHGPLASSTPLFVLSRRCSDAARDCWCDHAAETCLPNMAMCIGASKLGERNHACRCAIR